ncbi:MAG: hypothetical protein EOP54_18525 [Sphingobacteriales bacterium]|nr:MAG: hypothetical protein EOP54_18525 [Sphingobacteriales bacterium]
MKQNKLIIYASLLLALFVSACKVGKNYERPAVQLPDQFAGAQQATDTSSIASLQWKQFFTDTTLLSLIDKGIKHNYDLQIAVKRIDIAQQQLKQAKLLLLPQLNLQVTGQYNRPDWPLLFDGNYLRKPAYKAMIEGAN